MRTIFAAPCDIGCRMRMERTIGDATAAAAEAAGCPDAINGDPDRVPGRASQKKTPGTSRAFPVLPTSLDQAATLFAASWYSSIWSKFM